LNKAVFLDRDGVIIEDNARYISDCYNIKFLPKVVDAIKLLKDYLIIVVTNQAGVAKGYLTKKQVQKINISIQNTLAKKGALIDAFYYCPHHPEGIIKKYTKKCNCRKPKDGMLQEAALDWNIDLSESFLVGDKISDVQAGNEAGCRTILLTQSAKLAKCDHEAKDLYEAVKWIIKH
jgi:D,D-heptose 1,7-bisphosphate phosphatase